MALYWVTFRFSLAHSERGSSEQRCEADFGCLFTSGS
jgi:hypothetical protein